MDLPDIDYAAIGRTAVTAIPLLVALVGSIRGPGVVRSRLRHDVELLEKLPEGSDARALYETYIVQRIRQFSTYETESKRDPTGAAIAGVLIVVIGLGAVYLFALGTWWSTAVGAALAIFAAAGLSTLYESVQRVPRDEKGKRL